MAMKDSLRKSKSNLRRVLEANQWDYALTLSFGHSISKKSLDSIVTNVKIICRNADIKSVVVPVYHNATWHIHMVTDGLCDGLLLLCEAYPQSYIDTIDTAEQNERVNHYLSKNLTEETKSVMRPYEHMYHTTGKLESSECKTILCESGRIYIYSYADTARLVIPRGGDTHALVIALRRAGCADLQEYGGCVRLVGDRAAVMDVIGQSVRGVFLQSRDVVRLVVRDTEKKCEHQTRISVVCDYVKFFLVTLFFMLFFFKENNGNSMILDIVSAYQVLLTHGQETENLRSMPLIFPFLIEKNKPP